MVTPMAARRWGELPGELRTRLVQQLRERYGEDGERGDPSHGRTP